MMIFASTVNLQFLSGPDIILPRWVFWLMILAIGLLFLLLLIRDKGLRKGIISLFTRTKKRMSRARVQKKIKQETQLKLQTHRALGKKAWEASVSSEAAAPVLEELTALDKKKGELDKEIEEVDSEIKTLRSGLEAFQKDLADKIQKLEVEKKPHAEHLGQVQDLQKKALADLSHVDREIQQADKEKLALGKEREKVEQNTELSDEIRDSKVQELQARIFELDKKKEEFEAKLPDLREKETDWAKEITQELDLIKDFDRRIKTFQDEGRERRKDSDREIKKWQKKKGELQAQIGKIDSKKAPLFERLGQALLDPRVDSPELAPLYSRLDKVEETLAELEARFNALKT